jgi:ABC-2 type transport system ATP-binding protein
MKPIVEFEKIIKKRGRSFVLEIERFEVSSGEIVGVSGPNGSGKSTFLLIAAGLLYPDGGRLERDRAMSVSYLSEDVRFYRGFTASSHLRAVASVFEGDSMRPLEERGSLVDGLLHLRAGGLSKGMKKRLAIFAELQKNADLHVWDEPFSDLDESWLDRISEMIRKRAKEGASFIVASHVRAMLEKVSTRAVTVRDGRLTEGVEAQV